MAGLLDQQKPNQMQASVDPNMSTEDLYKKSRQQEAGFVQTAPTGYLDPNAPINAPANVGRPWVEGYIARQADNRNNAMVGMAEEKLGWQRTDREKKRSIDDGILTAADTGGFQGALDYLKTADPDRAMEFSMAKDKMDQSMLTTDLLKAALPTERAKIMAEGYGVLGKMGAALLNAKPQDRDNMYAHILPIIKSVNPQAPNALNQDAINMFQLAVSQATPENQLWSVKNSSTKLQSTLGVAMQDAHKAAEMYGPDSREAMVARKYLQDISDSKGSAVASTAAAMQQKAQKSNISGEAVLRKELLKLNTNYMTVQDSYNRIKEVTKTYSDPTSTNLGPTDLALVYSFIKVLDPATGIKEGEIALTKNAGGVPEAVVGEYNRLLKGGSLSPNMRNEYIKTSSQLFSSAKKSYDQNNTVYKDLAAQSGLNPDNVVLNVNSTVQTGAQTINSKADALIQKYQDNPDAIKKIEALRQNQIQALHQQGQNEDYRADQLLKTYGR